MHYFNAKTPVSLLSPLTILNLFFLLSSSQNFHLPLPPPLSHVDETHNFRRRFKQQTYLLMKLITELNKQKNE
jgi:hypothetical protein